MKILISQIMIEPLTKEGFIKWKTENREELSEMNDRDKMHIHIIAKLNEVIEAINLLQKEREGK